MKKLHFFKGLSSLLLLNLLIKPIWIFLIDRQVQNTVGHEAYGTYFSFLNLSIVLLFIADAGLSTSMVQQVADKKKIGTRQLLQIKFVLLLVYILACLLAGWISGIKELRLFVPIMFLQAIGSLLLFLRGLLTGNQFFRTDAYFSIADKTLVILFSSIFLYGWLQPITLSAFLQVQLLATFVVCAVLLVFVIRKNLLVDDITGERSSILLGVIPFAIIILLMSMHYRLDGFLLERWRTDGALQAGYYAMAYRLLDVANMIGYLTASFLVPFIARNKNDKPLMQ